MNATQFPPYRRRTTPATADATSAALSAGTNTVTIYTAPANRQSRIRSLRVCYTGTVAGVTIQLWANGVAVGPPIGGLTTAIFVDLLTADANLLVNPAQVFAVRVLGATATNTISYQAHFEDE